MDIFYEGPPDAAPRRSILASAGKNILKKYEHTNKGNEEAQNESRQMCLIYTHQKYINRSLRDRNS